MRHFGHFELVGLFMVNRSADLRVVTHDEYNCATYLLCTSFRSLLPRASESLELINCVLWFASA